ncbi:hypothetical protein [Paracoccus sp. KR1-242]|uniref:hypothetical protein n=1 Tax=Paracoccus sp. KR1-242 TaxID=3410028 RepID=UPI003C0E51B0
MTKMTTLEEEMLMEEVRSLILNELEYISEMKTLLAMLVAINDEHNRLHGSP